MGATPDGWLDASELAEAFERHFAVWLSNWTVATREYVAQLEDTGEKPAKKFWPYRSFCPGPSVFRGAEGWCHERPIVLLPINIKRVQS